MQKVLKNALVLSLSVCTMFSCREPEMKDVSAQSDTLEVIDFKGEKAKIPSDFPKELLNQGQAEFDAYYKKVSGVSALKTSGSEYHIVILPKIEAIG